MMYELLMKCVNLFVYVKMKIYQSIIYAPKIHDYLIVLYTTFYIKCVFLHILYVHNSIQSKTHTKHTDIPQNFIIIHS